MWRRNVTPLDWIMLALAALAVTGIGVIIVVGSHRPAPKAVPFDYASPIPIAVGSLQSSFGPGITTLGVAPQHVGDVIVVMAESDYVGSRLAHVVGGGVSAWIPALERIGTAEPHTYALWYGTVSIPGKSAIGFVWNGPINNAEYEAQEFTGGQGWYLDGAGSLDNAPSMTVSYPNIVTSGAGDLYFGFADYGTAAATGATPGYAYLKTPDNNQVTFGVDAKTPSATIPSAVPSTTVAIALAST